jgi:hypothetical protein
MLPRKYMVGGVGREFIKYRAEGENGLSLYGK